MSRVIDSNRQIKLGAAISYVAIFFSIAAGLIYTPWMIGIIGQSQYGLYILATSVISFFTMDFGLDEAVSRFLSRYNAEGNKERARDFLGITFKMYLVIGVLIFLALLGIFLFIDNIYTELTPIELQQFKIVFSIAALFSIVSFPFMPLNGILISNERFMFIKSVGLLYKVLIIVTMVVALILGYRLYALVVVYAAIGILMIAYKLTYVRKSNLISVNFRAKDKNMISSIFRYSIWTTIIIIAQRFIINITPTILGVFAGSVQISLFAIAMTIQGYVWIFADALNGLFLPKVTRMTLDNKNSTEVENLMIKVGRIQLILSGLLIVGFLTMGREFIILWLGADFIESYYIALFLIGTGIITLTQEIGNTALIALNEIKYRSFCSLIAAGISFTLSIVLSKEYGALGSSFAIFIGGLIGYVIGLNIVYHKILEVNVFRFFKECHFKMAIPLILTCISGFAIQYYFPEYRLSIFLIKAAILGCLYLFLMWFMAFNEFEKGLFIEVFKKIRSLAESILRK